MHPRQPRRALRAGALLVCGVPGAGLDRSASSLGGRRDCLRSISPKPMSAATPSVRPAPTTPAVLVPASTAGHCTRRPPPRVSAFRRRRLPECVVGQERRPLLRSRRKPASAAEVVSPANSSLPVTLAIDHSSPSGLVDANQAKPTPDSVAATASPISTVLEVQPDERLPLRRACTASRAAPAARKTTTAAATRPFDQPDGGVNRHHQQRRRWRTAAQLMPDSDRLHNDRRATRAAGPPRHRRCCPR